MSARLLLVILLLCCSAGDGFAESTNAPSVPLAVYLKADQPLSSLPLQSAKVELELLLAPAGIELVWIEASNPQPIQASRLISVELVGTCDPAVDQPEAFVNHTALASTAVVDGDVLPFITVDCAALNQFLEQDLVGHVEEAVFRHRAEVYGRAVARLLAHEFYHVLAKTQEHGRAGIAKTSFTLRDLMVPELTFEESELSMLRERAQPLEVAQADPPPASPEVTGGGASSAEENSGLYGYGKVQSPLAAAPEENVGAIDPDYIR